MKNLKSVLAVLAALCLLLCLTVPVFATEELTTTSASVSNEAVSTESATTVEATEATVEEGFEGAQPEAEVEEGDIQIDLDDLGATEAPEAGQDPKHDHEDETTAIDVVRVVLTVLEVIASLVLIVVVLIQSGKESGLSGAIAGNSESYMSKGKTAGLDKMLATSTKWVALAWVALTLVLSLISF